MKFTHRLRWGSFLLIVGLMTAVAQDLKRIEYDTDLVPGSVYRARRDTLNNQIGNDAIAVFYSAPERTRNGDVEYQYRQDDNFYYLTGFTEPNAILILAPKGITVREPQDTTKMMKTTEILFVQSRDSQREQWTGRRYGPEGVMKLRGLQYAVTNDKFKSMMQMIVFTSGAKYFYTPAVPSDLSGEIKELIQPLQSFIDQQKSWHSQIEIRDPSSLVFKMRIVKSPEEIGLVTKASQISTAAHNQAMMSCQPGMFEYELQALYEYVYRRMGAEYAGYPCIVGAAENSVILHYNTDRRQIKDGDLVLTDCAAEYHGYSSDVTRTFPANGKFSPAQREVYQIVLDAQRACIAMVKPGAAWRDISAKAEQVIEDGLLKLGIIKEKGQREFRKFYMHGVGHAVGLNVHDVGAPVLEAGMMYTVEPGIYIGDGIDGVDPKYYNIGVRIEDVVLVTKDGNKILSADSPREMDEIESLMSKKGIGNQSLR